MCGCGKISAYTILKMPFKGRLYAKKYEMQVFAKCAIAYVIACSHIRGSSQKFPALTYQATIFSTIYTSVKRISFTDSYESAADITSL